MCNITTFSNEKTIIVDYGQRIQLKQFDNANIAIRDMIRIIESKGWNLSNLKLAGNSEYVNSANLIISQNLLFAEPGENYMIGPRRTR